MTESMNAPLIYADFNNADGHGCLRLNCAGTTVDLFREGIELREGLPLVLHDEELEADGTAHFSAEERLWVAIIDWQKVRRFSRGSAS
jgi:hypothetical protein